jgi:hypothetical protein
VRVPSNHTVGVVNVGKTHNFYSPTHLTVGHPVRSTPLSETLDVRKCMRRHDSLRIFKKTLVSGAKAEGGATLDTNGRVHNFFSSGSDLR